MPAGQGGEKEDGGGEVPFTFHSSWQGVTDITSESLWHDSAAQLPRAAFYTLKFVELSLCPSVWSILENVSCALEKNVFFLGEEGGYNVLKNVSSIVLFRISVALLIFCLEDLSIDVRS